MPSSALPTENLPPDAEPVGRRPEKARFLPGTLLAGRYRIVGLLGKGGMGEVYRADDLKLGQPVALKFLPRGFDANPGRLQRFLAEVRTARQVSHPNVCRIYDAGETDGQHFLSMEYIDGEDLASLLRRIGHLPKDKAIQIARQLCAGLAASHAIGVLHRDLNWRGCRSCGCSYTRATRNSSAFGRCSRSRGNYCCRLGRYSCLGKSFPRE